MEVCWSCRATTVKEQTIPDKTTNQPLLIISDDGRFNMCAHGRHQQAYVLILHSCISAWAVSRVCICMYTYFTICIYYIFLCLDIYKCEYVYILNMYMSPAHVYTYAIYNDRVSIWIHSSNTFHASMTLTLSYIYIYTHILYIYIYNSNALPWVTLRAPWPRTPPSK